MFGCSAGNWNVIEIYAHGSTLSTALGYADFGGYMQGCFAVLIGGIHFRSLLNQPSQAFDMAVINGHVQGCFAVLIAGIDIHSPGVKQLFQAVAMTVGSAHVQWRLTLLIGDIDARWVDQAIETFPGTFSGSSVQYGNNICAVLYQNAPALEVFRQDGNV